MTIKEKYNSFTGDSSLHSLATIHLSFLLRYIFLNTLLFSLSCFVFNATLKEHKKLHFSFLCRSHDLRTRFHDI